MKFLTFFYFYIMVVIVLTFIDSIWPLTSYICLLTVAFFMAEKIALTVEKEN